MRYLGLPPLGLEVGERAVTLGAAGGALGLRPGTAAAGVVVAAEVAACSDLVQDVVSTMGAAMSSQARIIRGSLNDWIGWEPVLRALLDGRPVHEAGDVTFDDGQGGTLDLDRSFGLDDDPAEMGRFLEQAGFLHLRGVFEEEEMAALGADLDDWFGRVRPGDDQAWWATDGQGRELPVRVLELHEKSATLRRLAADDRFTRIGGLTGDGHRYRGSAEGLVKPLDIVRGLSDLPWHKDCGQGGHAYRCNALTCGISVTGADRDSGALGVIPGSHRANTMATGRDPNLDLQPMLLETGTGDVTVHCSDTLHRAHPPVVRPRQVVYADLVLPPLPGEERRRPADPTSARAGRSRRAALSDVQSRIEAADNGAAPDRYRAGRGR